MLTKKRLMLAAGLAAATFFAAGSANAFWGPFNPWNWGNGWGNPWYGPGYGYGYPGYWGGYPGHWGGYPGYWGGHPYGYGYGVAPYGYTYPGYYGYPAQTSTAEGSSSK
jgi:hypothetical protein